MDTYLNTLEELSCTLNFYYIAVMYQFLDDNRTHTHAHTHTHAYGCDNTCEVIPHNGVTQYSHGYCATFMRYGYGTILKR